MSHVRLLVNPAAGRGSGSGRLELLNRLAAAAGAEVVASESAADLEAKARKAAEEGVERLLVVGGDGSMHHAAQGLANTSCALAPVPQGTGNDLATVLGAPKDTEAAVERALTAPVHEIDLGRATGAAGSRYFVSYCGAGFDSEVTRFANEEVKWLRGPLIYAYAVVRTLARFVPPGIRIEHDGGVFEGRSMLLIAANSTTFGGGMKIAPEARLDDGLFDLVRLRDISKPRLLWLFPKVYSGRHVGHPAVEILRSRRLRIALDRTMTLYGDGEALLVAGEGEVIELELIPGGLRVVGELPNTGSP